MPVRFSERKDDVVLQTVVHRPSGLPPPVVLQEQAELASVEDDRRRNRVDGLAVLARGLLWQTEKKVREVLPAAAHDIRAVSGIKTRKRVRAPSIRIRERGAVLLLVRAAHAIGV